MIRKHLNYYVQHMGQDIPAGLVVFLVALPLCLGIAMACGAPLFAGIITGVVGGIVVAWLSGSQLSVSGPAAGLTVIVIHGIEQLGSFEAFLLSVSLAGLIQIALGYLRAGTIGAYFPAAVIKGMLAAIGLILIMKQIPHAVGYDADFLGDESYHQYDSRTTFSEIAYSLRAISPGAMLVSVVSLGVLLLWDMAWVKRLPVLGLLPGPLLAVVWGVAYHVLSQQWLPEEFWLHKGQNVNLPVLAEPLDFFSQFTLPDFSGLANREVYTLAFTLAVVASLETLLSLEATDKIDPLKRVAPTSRELKAQGLGNFLCGLLGGLPMTSVIVRSSANVNAGGRTKFACFVHGLLLWSSVMFLSQYLNLIPLASLAAVLLLTGYKLVKPALFQEMWAEGFNQFAPFALTITAILLTDLLKGMAIGMALGLFFVIRANFQSAISLTQDGRHYLLRLQKDISFLNKAPLRECLAGIEGGSYIIIDGSKAKFVDNDILETIFDFMAAAPDDNITVELKNLNGAASYKRSKFAH